MSLSLIANAVAAVPPVPAENVIMDGSGYTRYISGGREVLIPTEIAQNCDLSVEVNAYGMFAYGDKFIGRGRLDNDKVQLGFKKSMLQVLADLSVNMDDYRNETEKTGSLGGILDGTMDIFAGVPGLGIKLKGSRVLNKEVEEVVITMYQEDADGFVNPFAPDVIIKIIDNNDPVVPFHYEFTAIDIDGNPISGPVCNKNAYDPSQYRRYPTMADTLQPGS